MKLLLKKEVREMWSGMGYYSRCRKLHEAAQKVVKELDGKIPTNSQDLAKQLPGVGRYTAAAIASIAFNERVGVVDGNVIRVVSRLRRVGATHNSKPAETHFWLCSDRLVDNDRPGDFNQALMELGATVCTPQSPTCHSCPLKASCQALSQVNKRKREASEKFCKSVSVVDVEDCVSSCLLCLPHDEQWDPLKGVMNYPRRAKKSAVKSEEFISGVISYNSRLDSKTLCSRYLLVRRPKTGLLAGLWEFPAISVSSQFSDSEGESKLSEILDKFLTIDQRKGLQIKHVGKVSHLFSHRHHVYHVYKAVLEDDRIVPAKKSGAANCKWVTKAELLQSAISSSVKKILELSSEGEVMNASKRRGQKRSTKCDMKPLEKFFKTAS
eukprot:m.106345 g.106345  ORF g.106345 m.106345 type:complete len:382 (+) comp37258_c0_seq22:452-1597(+)